jgi:hypothetical protein
VRASATPVIGRAVAGREVAASRSEQGKMTDQGGEVGRARRSHRPDRRGRIGIRRGRRPRIGEPVRFSFVVARRLHSQTTCRQFALTSRPTHRAPYIREQRRPHVVGPRCSPGLDRRLRLLGDIVPQPRVRQRVLEIQGKTRLKCEATTTLKLSASPAPATSPNPRPPPRPTPTHRLGQRLRARHHRCRACGGRSAALTTPPNAAPVMLARLDR